MAMEQARAYLKQYHKEQDILVLDASSATVEQAAQALGTQPERIAKSLSFMVREHAVIVVAAGDCRVDNHAYKETFGCKAKMLKGDEVEAYTNHAIGGVCPFGVPANTRIYLDVSLKRFDFVYPACGTPNSAIRLTIAELETLLPQVSWVDVCRVA